jgi:hypothetical protein
MMRKNELFPETDQLQDLPETRDSESTEEEDFSTGISSKYKIKLISEIISFSRR